MRQGLIAVVAITPLLLGGCSIWPKMLTYDSEPEPVPVEAVKVVPVSDAVVSAPRAASKVAAVSMETMATKPVATAEVQAVAVAPVVQPVVILAPQPTAGATAAPAQSLPKLADKGATASHSGPGYYINVGLFASPSNSKSAYVKLKGAGLPVFLEVVSSKKGALNRIRVGPFATRAQAKAAAQKVHALHLDAVIIHR